MENLSLHDLSEGLLVKHKNNNKKMVVARVGVEPTYTALQESKDKK